MVEDARAYSELVDHIVVRLKAQQLTFWLGDEVNAPGLVSARQQLGWVARLTHFALQPLIQGLPSVQVLEEALSRLGVEVGMALADRTVGRESPLSLEDPFDERQPRNDAWDALLTGNLNAQPGFAHRAVAALIQDGFVPRVITTHPHELLERAALEVGLKLSVVNGLAGELPPSEGEGPYLFKVHGTAGGSDQWPMPLHRLHLVRQSMAMGSFRTLLESYPVLVLGYDGPDPMDIGGVMAHSHLRELLWVDASPEFEAVDHFEPIGWHERLLYGDLPERLLAVHGGWRARGPVEGLLAAICGALEVTVPGAGPDEVSAPGDEVPWWEGDSLEAVPAALRPLAEWLRTRWVGAFALITQLDLWEESTLADIFSHCLRLDQTLEEPTDRGWLRHLLAQTGRHEVEAAMIRHFRGEAVPPAQPRQMRRLEWAVAAIDWLAELQEWSPINPDELRVERTELRFSLTGKLVYLPKASEVIAELPSVTHGERWLRLKAAGAVSRHQWSVATQELCRALAAAGETGSPLMTLRSKVGLASVLTRLINATDPSPLVGCLKVITRRQRVLQGQHIDPNTCEVLAASLVLTMYDDALEGYAIFLAPLQPPLAPIIDDFVRITLSTLGADAAEFLFNRDPDEGRSYAYLSDVECLIAGRLAESPYARMLPISRWIAEV